MVAEPQRAVEDYLAQPYRVVVVREGGRSGDEGWVATVEELEGCSADGRTKAQATERLRGAMRTWIEDALRNGREIPPPRPDKGYSGRLLLRMSESLHARLAVAAEREGVSLNRLIVGILSDSMNPGRETTSRPAGDPTGRRRAIDLALILNAVVLVVVAVVAVVLLIAAWTG